MSTIESGIAKSVRPHLFGLGRKVTDPPAILEPGTRQHLSRTSHQTGEGSRRSTQWLRTWGVLTPCGMVRKRRGPEQKKKKKLPKRIAASFPGHGSRGEHRAWPIRAPCPLADKIAHFSRKINRCGGKKRAPPQWHNCFICIKTAGESL